MLNSALTKCAQKYLADDTFGPFITLKHHMSYTSSMVLRTAAVPKILWNSDYTVISYQESSLDLRKLDAGLERLFTEAEQLIAQITGGIHAEIPPDFHTENFANSSPGYSFIGLPPFQHQYKNALKHLMDPDNPHCIAALDSSNRLYWKQENLRHIAKLADDLFERIAVLSYIVPSQPARGTEFCRWRISNSDLMRNVFYKDGICFINMQLKTTNLTESLNFIPMFCPPRLSQILCDYLILIRRIEIIVCENIQIYSSGSEAEVRKEYFLVRHGARLDPDHFGRLFARYTDAYFGCRMTRRTFRHVAKGVKREYCPAMFHHLIESDEIGDSSSGHNSYQAAKTYGRVFGELAFLTTDRLHTYWQWGCSWHNALGVGEKPRPLALSLSNNQHWTVTNNNANRSIPIDAPQQNEGVSQQDLHISNVQGRQPHLHSIDTNDQVANEPQQMINRLQPSIVEMRTVMEKTLKDSFGVVCGQELEVMKTALQDVVTKGIADFKAAVAEVLNDANINSIVARRALSSPILDNAQPANSPLHSPSPRHDSQSAIGSYNRCPTPPLAQRQQPGQHLCPSTQSQPQPQMPSPSPIADSQSSSLHFTEPTLSRPHPPAPEWPTSNSSAFPWGPYRAPLDRSSLPSQPTIDPQQMPIRHSNQSLSLGPLPPWPAAPLSALSSSTPSQHTVQYKAGEPKTTASYALSLLRKSLNNPNATFRSAAQEEMVRRAKDCYENFVCIIPTGGGKSALWSVPIRDQADARKTTVVLTPFVSLAQDQVQHLSSQNVNVGFWNVTIIGSIPQYTVLFASFEHMKSIAFCR